MPRKKPKLVEVKSVHFGSTFLTKKGYDQFMRRKAAGTFSPFASFPPPLPKIFK